MGKRRKAAVFLSYGHNDAAKFAEHVRADLVSHGYDVWQDVKAIKVGHAWTEDIQQGLQSSDVLVALLSPHAVRRASGSDNADEMDSVCLDEIEYAVDSCRIPVVPIMAVTCEVPFRIFRLQYLDFRHWKNSKQPNGDLLTQLRQAIDNALATKRGPVRKWGWLPEPWDFGAFLSDRRRNFIGREWLIEEIDEWRRRGNEPALLIAGSPGSGKSAIVSKLVHENAEGQVLAYHCCQADTPATVDPSRFVQSIAAQLITRLEGFRMALENPALRDTLSLAATAEDPASAFEAGILGPLSDIHAAGDGHRYLLIDALDESLMRTDGLTIVDLLSTRLGRFPEWLRIVATTRPVKRVLSRFGDAKVRFIDDQQSPNSDDLRKFIKKRLGEVDLIPFSRASGRSDEQIQAILLDASAGNFLFATKTLEAVVAGHLSLEEIGELPRGLGSFYRIFLDRIFSKPGIDYEPTRVVLEAIVAAQDPPTRNELEAVTGFDADRDIPLILGRISSFVSVRDGCYLPFHKSFTDWLTGWDSELDQPEAEDYHLSLRKGHTRWAGYLLGKYKQRPFTVPVMRSLPVHLAGGTLWDDLARVLLDDVFLDAVVSGEQTTVFDLRRHLILAADSMPASHDQHQLLLSLGEIVSLDSNFIAAYPATLFQCCWNRGWWTNSPKAMDSDERQHGANDVEVLPKDLRTWMERWRQNKRQQRSPFWWLQLRRHAIATAGGPLARSIRDQGAPIRSLANIPNTTHVLSGADDGAVKIWDALTGALVRFLGSHEATVNTAAVSPDSVRAVTGSDDRSLKVWDLTTGSICGNLMGHEREVDAVVLTGDGLHAVSAARDRTVRMWDVERLKQVDEVKCNAWEWLNSIVPLPGSNHVMFGYNTYRGSLRARARSILWDWAPGCEKIMVGELDGSIIAMVPLPDPNCFLIATKTRAPASRTEEESSLLVFDKSAGTTRILHSWSGYGNGASSVTLCNETYAILGLESGYMQVFSIQHGHFSTEILAHGSDVSAVCAVTGSNFVVSGSSDGNIKVWHADRLGSERPSRPSDAGHSSPTNAAILDLAFAPDGRRIVAVRRDGTGSIWKLEPPRLHQSFQYYPVDDVTTIARASISENGRVVDYLALDHVYLTPFQEPGNYSIDLSDPEAHGENAVIEPGEADPAQLDIKLTEGDLVVSRQDSDIHLTRYRGDSPLTKVVVATNGRDIVCGDEQGELHFLHLTKE